MAQKIILTLFIAVTLVSCTTIAYQRLMEVEKGMQVEDVVSILESSSFNNKDVTLINDAKTDMYDISDKVDGSDDAKVLIAQKYDPKQKGSKTPYYIFAFDNEQLLYWGMPLEFNRSSNPMLIQIGSEAINIINEAYL